MINLILNQKVEQSNCKRRGNTYLIDLALSYLNGHEVFCGGEGFPSYVSERKSRREKVKKIRERVDFNFLDMQKRYLICGYQF